MRWRYILRLRLRSLFHKDKTEVDPREELQFLCKIKSTSTSRREGIRTKLAVPLFVRSEASSK